ncbi:16S rRNA (guanine(527)-N(7))-methyltransferase RsmG [Pseudaestuariivita atlantica]|uniref:Ribosomal RNA small subunit methyltransferase G n=1 Tax=Pseudaestuariivita atlantica TaxID=1317121 RepID=A0A0L1JPQ4_9RHOB|nr:16S rRNA (guanine(527)-N(7))-methyltransferase RsmG [Pseudaestuariivita atlantica]KNG93697.1 16S rRNA methyltransferase [Pseudaestuariivita atlantica]
MTDVSRETREALGKYAELVRKWSPRINLVAPSTLPNLETRHIADSLQVFHVKQGPWRTWVDLGSGGGFPGIVVAIAGKHEFPSARVTLVESDKRKATFLRAVIRELDLPADVLSQRVEQVRIDPPDVLSARALAPLPKLLSIAEHLLGPDTTCVFPKGKTWESEVEMACQEWSFEHDVVQSTTSPEAVILRIRKVSRV